jgi:hypothetical protein
MGLDGADRRYLALIADSYGGGPVGIETLSAALSEPRDALEDVIEPYLLQKGLIQRTPRGRMLAARAWGHLGLPVPPGVAGGAGATNAKQSDTSLGDLFDDEDRQDAVGQEKDGQDKDGQAR